MMESVVDEGMMQVGLVGIERGLASADTAEHHAQGVEDGDGQHRQGKGYQG